MSGISRSKPSLYTETFTLFCMETHNYSNSITWIRFHHVFRYIHPVEKCWSLLPKSQTLWNPSDSRARIYLCENTQSIVWYTSRKPVSFQLPRGEGRFHVDNPLVFDLDIHHATLGVMRTPVWIYGLSRREEWFLQ